MEGLMNRDARPAVYIMHIYSEKQALFRRSEQDSVSVRVLSKKEGDVIRQRSAKHQAVSTHGREQSENYPAL